MSDTTSDDSKPTVKFMIRKKVFKLFGASFHIYDPNGTVVGYCKQKAFKLREDIRIFQDDTMAEERMLIKARSIIDFGAGYDVIDSQSGQKIGALRRKGFSSIMRDSWEFLDENDQPIGKILEDSVGMAMVRRFLLNIFPQTFHATANNGERLAEYRTHFNPFVYKLSVTLQPTVIDFNTRLLLAGGILLAAIEGRQG